MIQRATPIKKAETLVATEPKGTPSQELLRIILEFYDIHPSDFNGRRRHPRLVRARRIFVLLARKHLTHSFPELAVMMGSPNHSSTITRMRAAEALMEIDHTFAHQANEIEAQWKIRKASFQAGPAPLSMRPYRVEGDAQPVQMEAVSS